MKTGHAKNQEGGQQYTLRLNYLHTLKVLTKPTAEQC